MNLRLDWCSNEAAAYAVEHWHYSHALQVGKSARIGVWEGGKFIGVVVFTMGSGGATKWAPRVGLVQTEMAELARVALRRGHQTPVSRILAIAVKMLRKQSPALRLLVSYADPAQGHHGGIYQAAGWLYGGKSTASPQWLTPDGRQMHTRALAATQFGHVRTGGLRTSDCQRVDQPAKHKYFFPFDSEIRARLAPMSKPYPKRVGSETADTAAFHVAKGGSTPTPTLQPPERTLCL